MLAAIGFLGASTAQSRAADSAAVAATLRGVTVSAAQHPGGAAIDWSRVAAAGYRFAAIEATQGTSYVNPYYSDDAAAAAAAGLDVSAYTIAIPNTTVAQTAADYAVEYSAYRQSSVTLPVDLVLENDPNVASDHTNACYGLSPALMVSWIQDFVSEIELYTTQAPIISTTAAWWDACTGGSTDFTELLWLASTSTTLPAGWTTWGFRQYSSTGTVPGIAPAGHVGLSYYNLSDVLPIEPAEQYSAGPGDSKTLQMESLNAKAGQSLNFSATGLPPGVTMSSSGLITGPVTATGPGYYVVYVTATAVSSGATATFWFFWYIGEYGPPAVTKSPGNQEFVVGSPVLAAVAANGATGLPEFTATGLPPGLTINPFLFGFITGWPTATGIYHVTVTAGDSHGQTATTSFTWTVRAAADTGPHGPVVLDKGGKCLDDPAGHTANGTRVDIATCTGKSYQQWTLAQDDTIRVSGRCLQEAGAGNGAAAVLAPCSASAAQRWRLGTSDELVNTASGRCLTDPSGATASGTRLDVTGCGGGPAQRWTGPAAQVASQFAGMCLDDPAGKTANGTAVDIQPCSGSANQKWTAEPDGTIRHAGRCLQEGAPAVLHSCTGSAAQRWTVVPQGQIGAELADSAGACLGTAGNNDVAGTKAGVQPCQPWQDMDYGIVWHLL